MKKILAGCLILALSLTADKKLQILKQRLP